MMLQACRRRAARRALIPLLTKEGLGEVNFSREAARRTPNDPSISPLRKGRRSRARAARFNPPPYEGGAKGGEFFPRRTSAPHTLNDPSLSPLRKGRLSKARVRGLHRARPPRF